VTELSAGAELEGANLADLESARAELALRGRALLDAAMHQADDFRIP
jgi:hypothetical protein